MQLYRERLWPSPWIFLATGLVIPASLLVFLPINVFVGAGTAIFLYCGCIAVLVLTSPVVAVTDGFVVAGRARLPLEFAGQAETYFAEEATLERGQRLDARAWLVIRGWVSPVVKVPVTDPADAAPYWLISSRKPEAFAAAIKSAKTE